MEKRNQEIHWRCLLLKCMSLLQNTNIRWTSVKITLKHGVIAGQWISYSCHVVKPLTVKSNQTFNQIRKTNLPVTIKKSWGQKQKIESINQTNKVANKSIYRSFKLRLILLLCHPRQRRNTNREKESGYIQKLRKIPAAPWESMGY